MQRPPPGKQLVSFSPLPKEGLFSSRFGGHFCLLQHQRIPVPLGRRWPYHTPSSSRTSPKPGQTDETTTGSPLPRPPLHGGFSTFNLSLLKAGEQPGWAHAGSAQPRWDSRSCRIRAGRTVFSPAAASAGALTSHFHPWGNSSSLIAPKTAAEARPATTKYTGQIWSEGFFF